MPDAMSHADTHTAVDGGPKMQFLVPASVHGLAGPVPISGNITSNVIKSNGYKLVAVGVQSSQAGNLEIQRYLDDAGTIPQGPVITVALTANAAGVLNLTDGYPFKSFKVTITNSSASVAANLSNLGILLQSD